jgi:hypothetical protein
MDIHKHRILIVYYYVGLLKEEISMFRTPVSHRVRLVNFVGRGVVDVFVFLDI